MQFFRENKVLLIWGAISIAMAFYFFSTPSCISEPLKGESGNDSLIYFSFSQPQIDKIDAYFELKHQNQGFNGVVLLGQKDSVFYSKSFGYANYTERDSLNMHSSFQLASVSKQFTAVAILQLYQKGLLNLNDSIQKFFPEFPIKNITIHQLMCHRSGLANYQYFMQYIPTTYDTILFSQDIVNEIIKKNPESYYRPNQRYHYSNTGYALLAAVVEKVSGVRFSTYLRQNIFEPLNMNDSYTYLDIYGGEATSSTIGYLYRWRMEEHNYLDGVLGDKGVYCSAIDLFKWDQGLYSGKIIDTAVLNLAFRPIGKPQYLKSNYGYGWRMFNWQDDSIKVLFHGGWWQGYKTLLMRIPQDSTTIVVLKNRSKGAAINSKQLLNILYPPANAIADSVDIDDNEL